MAYIDTVRRLAPATVLVIPLLLAGCIQGEGPVSTETRTVRPFTRLEIGSGIQVMLTIGPAGPALVSAQANLLPAVATEVSGDTLSIEAKDDFTTADPVLVTITAPTLDAVSMSGGAQLAVDGLAGGELDLGVKGGARVRASGTADTVRLVADGGSTVELDGLVATSIEVMVAGGTSATVHATDTVRGSASGGARLTVAGDADLDVTASGGAAVERAPAS